MLTLVMALSVSRAIEEVCGIRPGIKWPNDLVVNGKKLCGILTEMSADMDQIHYVVIGTGINVNPERFPEDIAATATSLFLETGQKVNRALVAAKSMEWFEKDYERFLTARSMAALKDEYEERLVNMDRPVTVLSGEDSFRGIARGIDEGGCLIVEKEDGTRVSLSLIHI